ncbi:Sulfate permease [Labilithrix luteola]|uniref:Sulfate permease n=1 Tax=Labilithrix luteola TaxID=1391654 RepID=A0A0K1Q7N3_9BACT|nr:SulP family inorganic anion transporter [Labilithrix luteola]AKV01677.1 Sulfate permease [Labilithrix luteola]
MSEPATASRAYAGELRALLGEYVDGLKRVARARSIGQDLLAGLTVAAVALPLNVGLAIASGMPPSAGLVAGAVGGAIAAFAGGSQYQVSGPAAALSVMVLALAKEYGVTGVAAATVYVGVVELVLAFALAGRVIKYVPESVLAGFTTGVGLKLLDQQLPELLGFPEVVDWASKGTPSTIDLAVLMHRPKWLHDVSWLAAVSGVFVAFFVTSMRPFRRFPAAIVAIALVTFVSVYLGWDIERVSSVGAVPSHLPSPALPLVADEQWIDLFTKATPLALLAGVESLLSASAADRMANAKKPHNSNIELFGQGIANLVTGLFSGMPVTGVVARTGVNVQSGAKTRVSAFAHSIFLAAAVLFLSRFISQVPLAALAGLLCVIGFRLLELGTLVHLYKAHKLEAVAFLVAAGGTVSGHLMVGLIAGLAIHFANSFLHRHERAGAERQAENKKKGIRAVLHREKAEARRPAHLEPMPAEYRKWLSQIREEPLAAASAYVHPAATVIGRVVLGEHVHIAADTSVRADEGSPFYIGSNTNIQDGVVLHALKDKRVVVAGESWAIYVGKNVSIAHDALVHGPCYIGDETFVGFKAVVHDSVVGAHCFVGIGAVVVGVEIPDGRFVPHGRIVDSADAVDALPLVSEVQKEFNEDVVEVNRGLAVAYHTRERERKTNAQRNAKSDDNTAIPIWDARWSPSVSKERF